MESELETPFIISQIKNEDNTQQKRGSSYSPHYQPGQPQLRQKKQISTRIRIILMQVFDIIGVLGFLFYCGLMQTYLSTFYSLMFLLIINFTFQSFPKGIGMFSDEQQKNIKIVSIDNFLSKKYQNSMSSRFYGTFDNDEQLSEDSENQHEIEILNYKPLYWIVFYDIKKQLWYVTLIFSFLFLIFKITIYILLFEYTSDIIDIMSIQNFEGLEIFFIIVNEHQIQVTFIQYFKAFGPNIFVLLFSFITILIHRVNNKINLEQLSFQVNTKAYKFYLIMIWVLLIFLISSVNSLQGFVFFFLQLLLTIKIFVRNPHRIEISIIKSLKYYLYFTLISLFMLSTPIGIEFQQNNHYLSSFLGLDLFEQLINKNWKAIFFLISTLLLFSLLCLLSEKVNDEKRRMKLEIYIKECQQYYQDYKEYRKQTQLQIEKQIQERLKQKREQLASFTSDSYEDVNFDEIVRQQEQKLEEEKFNPLLFTFQEKIPENAENENDMSQNHQIIRAFNEIIFAQTFINWGEYIKAKIDRPIVTLRILQLLAIAIVIIQKTYFSIGLLIWVLITGSTKKLSVIKYWSVILAIPSMLLNFITFYYANITGIDNPNNPLNICDSGEFNEKLMIPSTLCQKLGFIQLSFDQLNIMLMNISICMFIYILKQIKRYQDAQFLKFQRVSEGLHFMAKKSKKNNQVGFFTLLMAIILKASYFISLIILFVVGFQSVNLIQLILVLFLLIFLINNSSFCLYRIKVQDQKKYVLVPFIFKYWIALVFYVQIIVFTRYIYLLFYYDQFTQNINLTLTYIGFNENLYQEILIWFLFYFVQLQQDSYRSKLYMKYSNRILQIIMAKPSIKHLFPNYQIQFGLLQLLMIKSFNWISFALNICYILFTPFSFLNAILLLLVGLQFTYFVTSQMTGMNYRFIRRMWYSYLNLLVITFFIRYLSQFLCVLKSNQLPSWIMPIYNNLSHSYEEYGLYYYRNTSMAMEYLPDMLSIFFGALSLDSYTKLKISQEEEENQLCQQTNEKSDSAISIDSLEGKEAEDRLLERKLKEDIQQIRMVMKIKVLDEMNFLKGAVHFFANINTDLVTLIVVFCAVFYFRNIAVLILLVVYLSFFMNVHQKIFDMMESNRILQILETKINKIKTQYLKLDRISFSEQREDQEIKQLINYQRIDRLKIRLKLKRQVWRISFYFSALCILMTYLSQILTTNIILSFDVQNEPWYQWLSFSFFVFGTYIYQYQETNQCFCSSNDLKPYCQIQETSETKSDILQIVWFYVLLQVINSIDTLCTEILTEDLQMNEKINPNEEENDQEKKKSMMKIDDENQNLKSIKEEEEEEDKESKTNEEQEKEQIPAFYYGDFKIEQNYIQVEQNIAQQEEDKGEDHLRFMQQYESFHLMHQVKRYTKIINYYKAKEKIMSIILLQGLFTIVQRIFTLVLILNTLLVNNVFSLFYLGVATYLFLSQASLKNLKLLNSFSVFAIFIQYTLLLLNYVPKQSDLPPTIQIQAEQFSLIQQLGLTNPYWLSYLGFDKGEIVNCSQLNDPLSQFQNEKCEKNNLLNWVFVINTIVLCLIYSYFLILELISYQIINQTTKMENERLITQSMIKMQIQKKQKIFLNYQTWKGRLYQTKQSILHMIIRNGHIFTMGIILLLSQCDRTIFNFLEIFLGLIFFLITEMYFKWPYYKSKKNFLKKYFGILFIISVISICMFTLLKMPYLLDICVSQKFFVNPNTGEIESETPNYLVFYCAEVFNIRIEGMVFIMFFISLNLDLLNSQDYERYASSYSKQSVLKARMVSKALAYNLNHKKYKEIRKVQEQKNLFKLIQISITDKLKIWHKKMKQQQGIEEDEEEEEEIVEIQNRRRDTLKQNRIASLVEEDSQSQLQKGLIIAIKWIWQCDDQIKYMGFSNLMDYILAQNQMLQRQVSVKIEEYLQGDHQIFWKEMEYLDKFYSQVYKRILLDEKIDEDIIQQISVDNISNENINQKHQTHFSKWSDDPYSPKPTLYREYYDGDQEVVLSYKKYQREKELTFVNIYDEDMQLELLNTKIYAQNEDLGRYRSVKLMMILLRDVGRLMIASWNMICYIMIILYVAKNSGITGIILPILLFVWVLVDEREAPILFWKIAYGLLSLICLGIFILSLSGVNYPLEKDQNQGWYAIYYNDQGYGIKYEIMVIWMIVLQIQLQKQWGIYYKSLNQVENIFRGYVRMKLNKFNDVIKEQLRVSSIASQYMDEEPDWIEGKIIQDPSLIGYQRSFNFFTTTFNFKFPKPGIDLYAYIVTIQLMILIYILLFFSSMTTGAPFDMILKYNQIPGSMVLALLAHIIVMVLERYITLKEDKPNKIWKLQFILKYLLQILLIVLVYWFVFIKVANSQKQYSYSSNKSSDYTISPLTLSFFLLYCLYFFISCLQLKYGYKELKLRNTYLKNYTQASFIIQNVFQSIPFLYELKVLMDWTFLKTSLDVFQWFKLEDIQTLMFFAKIQSSKYIQRPIGSTILPLMKCSIGCTLVTFILLCIVGPLLLFSTLNPSASLNLVESGSLSINLCNLNTGLVVPIYCTNQFYGMNTISSDQIDQVYGTHIQNPLIINAPENGALQQCQSLAPSNNNWEISQPILMTLEQELNKKIRLEENYNYKFNITYQFSRENELQQPQKYVFEYPNDDEGLKMEILESIYRSMTECIPTPLILPYFYVKSIQLYTEDGSKIKPQPIQHEPFTNVTMTVYCNENQKRIGSGLGWWEFQYHGLARPIKDAKGFMFFIVSDKYSPLTSGFSIITIYTSVILLIASLIRSMFSGQVWILEFSEMLQPDDLLLICEAISIARSQKDFIKENMLYFELIDILRSPEIVKVMTASWSDNIKKLKND